MVAVMAAKVVRVQPLVVQEVLVVAAVVQMLVLVGQVAQEHQVKVMLAVQLLLLQITVQAVVVELPQ
jgi:hypothetical protein